MIYFLQLDSGAIKIGTTENLEQRIVGLARHYGHRPAVLHTMEGDVQTEREIHDRFSHLRFGRTEQFRPGPDLMEFIGKPLLVGQNPDAVEAVEPMPSTSKKVTITLSLLPSMIASLERIVAEQPELDNRSRACDWAVRVATAKGGES